MFPLRDAVRADMLHDRHTSQMARNLLLEARRQFEADADQDKFEQFEAFVLGKRLRSSDRFNRSPEARMLIS